MDDSLKTNAGRLDRNEKGSTVPSIPKIVEAPLPDARREDLVAEAATPDVHRYFRSVYKRRWSAITAFLIVVVVGGVWSFTTPPVYEARVRVLVEPERLNLVKIEDVVEQQATAETQQAILQSRWLAKKTLESVGELPIRSIDALRAAAGPAASPSVAARVWSAVASWKSTIVDAFTPSPPAATPEPDPEAARVDGFLSGLTVVPPLKGLLEIRYRSGDPSRAAKLANAHAEEYIRENVEVRFAAVKEVSDWLAARVSEQREKVDSTEAALQRFREVNHVPVGDPGAAITAKATEVTAELTRVSAARLEKETALNRAEALRNDAEALLRLPQMAADPVVQGLRLDLMKLQQERAILGEKLQDRHPDMIKLRADIQATQAKLQTEMERVTAAMRADVDAARAAERSVRAALDDQKQRASARDEKGLEASILQREAESSRQIYEMLMQRARETNIAKEIKPTEIRILDAADVPRAPIAPNHQRDLTQAVLAGFALALALVFGFEYLDNAVNLPDDIRTELGLPFLGLLPAVKRGQDIGELTIANHNIPPLFVEAVRSLRTNVMFSMPDEGLKAILVTSASPGEGKSVVAANLAVALAQSGARVLLLDTDMRRPAVHRLVEREREPGLSNLLVGESKASDVILPTRIANLWLLGAGHDTPNPPELLGSQRFKKLLSGLKEYFDWVVIDAAPVLPVTDACVAAAYVKAVVFVVGAGRVSRPAARRALEQLDAVGAHILGAVLNRADVERNAYYYRYAGYYGSQYSDYYVRAASS